MTNGPPRQPDWTPEEKARIFAEMHKRFTVEDLLGYVNDEDEKIPAEVVMARAEELLRQLEARDAGAAR
jgi:hypothetical protein